MLSPDHLKSHGSAPACLSQTYLPAQWHSHYITPFPNLVTCHQFAIIILTYFCVIYLKFRKKGSFENVCKFLMSSSISLSQFEFVWNHSTLQQFILYSEFLISAGADHCQVYSLYVDIRKTFDIIPHNKFLSKLWSIGITCEFWLFFKVYLTNRHQWVVIERNQSDSLPVTSGVPQIGVAEATSAPDWSCCSHWLL